MNELEKTIHENGIEILSELLFLAPKFVSGVDRKAELAAGRTEDDEPECFADFYDELEGLTYRDEMEIEIGLNILKKYETETCWPEALPFPEALNVFSNVEALDTYLPIVRAAAKVNPEEFSLLAELAEDLETIVGDFAEEWEPNF